MRSNPTQPHMSSPYGQTEWRFGHLPERMGAFLPPVLSGLFGAELFTARLFTARLFTARLFGAALVLIVMLMANPAKADVNSELNRFWNDLGATSNFTGPSSFKGQAAGYYTGGSLRVRSGVRNAQLGTLSLPSVEAGCGGIDIFSGSLSIISTDELKQLTNAIVRNGIGFALDLALETMAPVIAETMKDLRAKLQDINQANINSCEAAESLVMGVWPKTERASAAICARIGAKSGKFADYAASKHRCGETGNYDDTLEDTSDTDKKQWPDNINIAWDILTGDHLPGNWLASDKELAEIMLTMTGTIIIHNKEVKSYAGFGRNDAFIDWFINGGQSAFFMFSCPDDPCLKMIGDASKSLTTKRSLKGKVEREINGLISAIRNDTNPSAAQKALVNRTSLPLYRILNVYAAYSGPIIETQRTQLIEAITLDLALIYIRELVEGIRMRAEAAPLVGQEVMTLWQERLDALALSINARQLEGSKGYATALEMVDRVRLIETYLGSRFSAGFGKSSLWSPAQAARQ